MLYNSPLKTADELLERNHRIYGLETTLKRHPRTLKNWVRKTSHLAPDEIAYLDEEDLCYASSSFDNEFSDLKNVLAMIPRRLYRYFGKVSAIAGIRAPHR